MSSNPAEPPHYDFPSYGPATKYNACAPVPYREVVILFPFLDLPLCPKTLHLIKYKDSGREHKFRLVDRVSAGWRMFGILTCITDNILDEWELRFMRDPVRCWEKVMSKWLDDGESEDYPVTWQGLYNLLKDAEYGEVEMELSKAVRLATSDPDLEIDEDCNR